MPACCAVLQASVSPISLSNAAARRSRASAASSCMHERHAIRIRPGCKVISHVVWASICCESKSRECVMLCA